MPCRSGCPTQDHASWGECARQAGLQIGDLTGRGAARTRDRTLNKYADARRQGVQPESVKPWKVDEAMRAAGA